MKKNKTLIAIAAVGVVIFSIIVYMITSAGSTVKAVVPSQDISAGTLVTKDMLTQIDISSNTPSGFITDPDAILGQKLKFSVKENQLLYPQNIMVSWRDSKDEYKIPDDYVVTSIRIPRERAVGGLVSVGDYVDILGVPNNTYQNSDMAIVDQGLGEMSQNKYQANGIAVYWVLSNVRILETNAVNLSGVSGSGSKESDKKDQEKNAYSSSEGDYYIVALSYSDYQKMQLAKNYLDFWMNIVPAQNESKDPLISEMQGAPGPVKNAQAQSKIAAAKKKADEKKAGAKSDSEKPLGQKDVGEASTEPSTSSPEPTPSTTN